MLAIVVGPEAGGNPLPPVARRSPGSAHRCCPSNGIMCGAPALPDTDIDVWCAGRDQHQDRATCRVGVSLVPADVEAGCDSIRLARHPVGCQDQQTSPRPTPTAGACARMWTLSGFADEIDADFARQCTVARDLGLDFIEIRSAWDTGVLDLTGEQLQQARDLLTDHSLGVSAIGSPVGKIFIDDDFDDHLRQMHRAVEVAHHFHAPYIRIFSFFQRPEIDPAQARQETIRRLRALADIAEPAGVTLLHENDKEVYGDTPERCLDLVTAVDSPRFKLVWDPANFVQVDIRPHDDGYGLLRPHLEYVQIKDARASDGIVVPAGEGDAQIRQTIRALHDDGFEGFFSLEPHLESHSTSPDIPGAELFRIAWKAFTDMLDSESIPYA